MTVAKEFASQNEGAESHVRDHDGEIETESRQDSSRVTSRLRTKLGQNPEVPTLLASHCSSGSVVVVR